MKRAGLLGLSLVAACGSSLDEPAGDTPASIDATTRDRGAADEASGRAPAPEQLCTSSETLDGVVACVLRRMPRRGSGGYVGPSAAERTAWRSVVREMLCGQCTDIRLPAELAGAMALRAFVDVGVGRRYCVLIEEDDADGDGSVDRGLGTVIVDPVPARELSHQAPHPLYDRSTEEEGVRLFQASGARTYLLAGAHRNASSTASTCEAQYGEADAAHDDRDMLQASTEALATFYGPHSWTAVQWHLMSRDTCPEVNAYLSLGVVAAPPLDSAIARLRTEMRARHPGWSVETPRSGGPRCTLHATNNVQGRLLNGVDPADVCTTEPREASGRFIHIEQQPGFSGAEDWEDAIEATWPLAAESALDLASRCPAPAGEPVVPPT